MSLEKLALLFGLERGPNPSSLAPARPGSDHQHRVLPFRRGRGSGRTSRARLRPCLAKFSEGRNQGIPWKEGGRRSAITSSFTSSVHPVVVDHSLPSPQLNPGLHWPVTPGPCLRAHRRVCGPLWLTPAPITSSLERCGYHSELMGKG